MDEIIALQAALAKAQLADTAHRVSERNAVEIVLKLMELKKVQLIFSKSGREYVTPAQVIEEIEMELISHGGRVTLVDLTPILNIDFNHIEVAARALVQKKKTIVELSGQLLTSWYLDGVVEEINESLQESGSIAIVALAQRFNLPAEFMRNAIEQRLGSYVQGYIEEGQLYTQSFIQLHTARTRGIFRALVKPTPLRSVIQRYSLMENRVCKEVASMIKEGVLNGSLKGADDRAVYTPALFQKGQQNGANEFFQANGFLELKKLERLSIANPKAFLSAQYPTALQLQTLALSEGLVQGVVLSVEDTLNNHTYMNAASILPQVLSRQEVEQVLTHAIGQVEQGSKSASSQLLLMQEIWAVSTAFKDACQEYTLQQLTKQLDDEEAKIAAEALKASQSQSHNNETTPPVQNPARKAKPAKDESEEEEEEEQSSKRGGKAKPAKKGGKKNAAASDSEDEAPAAKSKPAKKAGRSKRDASSEEEDEAPAPAPLAKIKSKSKSSSSSSSVGTSTTTPPLTKDKVQKWLKAGWTTIVKKAQASCTGTIDASSAADASSEDGIEELLSSLASLVQPSLISFQKQRLQARQAAVQAQLANAASGSSSNASSAGASLGPSSDAALRRAHIEAFRAAVQEQLDSITLYQRAVELVGGTGGGDDKAASSAAAPIPLRGADKSFLVSLESHLSKTLIAGLLDLLVRQEAYTSLTPGQQAKLEGLENLISAAPASSPSESKEDAAAAAKPQYTLNRTPLSQKERESILAALPKRSQDALKPLVESLNKEPSVWLEKFDQAASPKGLELRVKKLDKKSERSAIFTLRKSLMASLATEARPATVLHLTVLLVFAKVHGVVVHAPAKVLQTMRRMLKPDMQPIAYAKLRRYNQLVMRALRGDAPEESTSSLGGGGGSDEDDEIADENLPKESRVNSMPLADVETELKNGLEQIRAFGMDASTAVNATKGK